MYCIASSLKVADTESIVQFSFLVPLSSSATGL